MNTFRDHLLSLGFMVTDLGEPGRWHRCATIAKPRAKNGSYKLSEDGSIGFAQDFATMAEPCVWRPEDRSTLPAYNRDEMLARIAAKRRALIEATKRARAFYELCEPVRDSHPYLTAKELTMQGCEGLRVDSKGALVIPMMLKGIIYSVQRIAPDGSKLFWAGATTNGTSYILPRRKYLSTILCEGLATGLTLYSCLRRRTTHRGQL